ncbi:reverse transcriptase domain-containing protein [Tanacetum coccineum]
MSTHSGPSRTTNTPIVRNTVGRGKEKSQENPNEPASDAALREFCDKNYNQLLSILAEKMHQEKVQQEKLKAVKARLSFELEEHDIQYRPRTSVKGQILADFIVEHGSGARLILTNPEGMEFTNALRFRFDATNNEAEYEALIARLKIAEQMGIDRGRNEPSRSFRGNVNKKAMCVSKDCFKQRFEIEGVKSKVVVEESEGKTSISAAAKFGSSGKRKEITFGLPGEIISEIGEAVSRQSYSRIGKIAEKLCIRQYFAFVKHPQTNGLVKRANRSFREGIKARLDERSKN